MAERNAAAGYMAVKKETTPGVAVTPNVYVPYYKQSLHTDIHLIKDTPVIGNLFKTYQGLQGQRSHGGSLRVMAEPNTAGYLLDMLATRTNTTGANPYTHTFKDSLSSGPNSYTVDVSLISQVVRFFGVQASKLGIGFDNEELVFDLEVSALGSFYGREIGNIVTTTVDLKTDYDPSPTTGLVAGDLVRVVKADGSSSLDTTISSITDGDTVVLGNSAAAFAAGDMLVLRPASPSYTLLTPFLWPRSQFCFGATAAAALSAAQTRLEQGSVITLMNDFQDNDGSKRSGGFDPASLVRTVYDVSMKIGKYFDTADEIKNWNALIKRSCVFRSYSGTDKELRITLNHIKSMTDETPTESAATVFHQIEYAAQYDPTDGQAFDVKVINAVSSI